MEGELAFHDIEEGDYVISASVHVLQENYQAAVQDFGAYLELEPNGPTNHEVRRTRDKLEKQVQPQPGANPPSTPTPAAPLDVSFAVPDVPDLKFDTITIYGMQIIGKQRSHDMAYPSVHGSWQPKEHVEFSVRVLKEYADPSLGWNLTFCIGSTAGCYPSPNLLTLITQPESVHTLLP